MKASDKVNLFLNIIIVVVEQQQNALPVEEGMFY